MSKRDKQLEEMAAFFDVRATTYEAHMARDPKAQYWNELLEEHIPEERSQTRILDLGCGTGMEIKHVWKRQPNARIARIDLSEEMLGELKRSYQGSLDKLEIVHASYFEYDFGNAAFDHAIACSTMHHWLPERKLGLYARIHRALKRGGTLILLDYYVTEDVEKKLLDEYRDAMRMQNLERDEQYHIDIPFTTRRETAVLEEAGFAQVSVIEESLLEEHSSAMIVARKDR
jgi:tRNA (cmo5U34)-methyltransferase